MTMAHLSNLDVHRLIILSKGVLDGRPPAICPKPE
jgi:hypothetical protein